MVIAYNAARNDPYKESQRASYTPIDKAGPDAIKEVGMKRFDDSDDVDWLTVEKEETAKKLEGAGNQ